MPPKRQFRPPKTEEQEKKDCIPKAVRSHEMQVNMKHYIMPLVLSGII